MGGIFPNETTIYIAPSSTNMASLATSDKVIGEVTNWSISGGAQEVESVPVIGGFVDKEMPRDQYEVSFDVICSNLYTSTFDRYDIYKYGTTLVSTAEGSDKMIAIAFTSNSLTKVIAMNNCRAITWEPEMAADDMLKGTITFKFSPTTALGVANLKTSTVSGASLPALTW